MSIFISVARQSATPACEMHNKIRERWFIAGVCIGLIALVWVVFGQTVRFPFINFDDPEYVYEQPEINAGLTAHGIIWAFTRVPSPNWFPLTNISHMFDAQFYGLNAGGYHLTNVLLHTIGAILLFVVLWRVTGSLWPSAFVAAVFAIHPLRAESVAWVTERKDVLSGVFFMLTLGAYARYTFRPALARYLVVLILFACGLMSKPMLVTMPFVLLLLDYWPLNRSPALANRPSGKSTMNRKDIAQRSETRSRNSKIQSALFDTRTLPKLVAEKIPLVALSILCAVVTSLGIPYSRPGITQSLTQPFTQPFRLVLRIENAIVNYVAYIRQMFWPADLAVFYPHRRHQLTLLEIAPAFAFLIAVTVTAFALRKRSPYLLVGWLWYLSMLVPVVGLVGVHAAHADRYTYLPQIGLYLLLTWAIADLSASWRYRRQVLSVAAAIVIFALGWSARRQTAYWRDSELLWDHAIAVTSDNDVAHANLADLLLRRGHLEGAISHCEEALRIQPRNADAENNLGLALLQKGDETDAALHFKKCLEITPDHMNAAPNLAWILATSPNSSTRDGPKAVELAEKVHRRAGHPNAIVLRTLAAAYAETGRFSDAIEAAEQAMEIARVTGNEGLVIDLERNIAAYRLNHPLRSGP